MQPSPKLLTHCPLCETVYEDQSIHLLGEHGGMRLFHLTCQACSHAVLAVILENQNGIRSLGVMTDMEAQDVFSLQSAENISANECLDLRAFLERDSKRFCEVLLTKSQKDK